MTPGFASVFLLVACGLLLSGCHQPCPPPTPPHIHQPVRTDPPPHGSTAAEAGPLAAADPAALLRLCRDQCRVNIRDYVCLFIKKELLADGLSPERHMQVRFREEPFSVDLKWTKNPQLASRMSYVQGWRDSEGNPIAHFHLRGGLGLLVPKGVYRGIHAEGIGTESRRPIDQFGLCHILDMIVSTNDRAAGHPDFSLRFLGEESFDERPTLVFERTLPYTGEGGDWPDRVLKIHIDAEHLVPLALFAYADDQKKNLLGRYEFHDLRFNVGLTDADFGPPPPANLTAAETDHHPRDSSTR